MKKLRIKLGTLRKLINHEISEVSELSQKISESGSCSECGMPMEACECSMEEVAPPGREKQVKALKKVPGIDNPWAVAWAQQNKHGKPSKKG